MFFSHMNNLIMPGRGVNMGDGWETKRNRTPNNRDWVIVRLAHKGIIQKALRETDMPPSNLIMPWEGVKFDAKGQNTKTRGIFVQTINEAPSTVWPFDMARTKLVWPKP